MSVTKSDLSVTNPNLSVTNKRVKDGNNDLSVTKY